MFPIRDIHVVTGPAGDPFMKCLFCDYWEDEDGGEVITDGFGHFSKVRCDLCGARMYVMRPGDIRCSKCDERKES